MEPIRVVGRKQKLMSFLRSEEGNAGRSKVLATGAVLGGSVLAQMLLATNASAANCSGVWECTPTHAVSCFEQDPNCDMSCPAGWGVGKVGTCIVRQP